MLLMTDIHVRSFTGTGLKPYLHSVAKLRMDVFKEYPYFEEPDLEHEMTMLRKICTHRESIGVLIFDNTTLVGVSLGYPLAMEGTSLLRPFRDRQCAIDSYFYFADSALLKSYRGRGIGHHFFDARETHVVHQKKYHHICFCVPDHPESDPNRPLDSISLHDFWRKRGYVRHPEMKCSLSWKQIDETEPTEKQMIFWSKDLKEL